MARFKLTLDLFVEADSESQAIDKVVAWVQSQGPNPCWDWRAHGTPTEIEPAPSETTRP